HGGALHDDRHRSTALEGRRHLVGVVEPVMGGRPDAAVTGSAAVEPQVVDDDLERAVGSPDPIRRRGVGLGHPQHHDRHGHQRGADDGEEPEHDDHRGEHEPALAPWARPPELRDPSCLRAPGHDTPDPLITVRYSRPDEPDEPALPTAPRPPWLPLPAPSRPDPAGPRPPAPPPPPPPPPDAAAEART